MPQFSPVRVKGGWSGLRRLVRNRQRAVALGLAVTAVALVAAGPRGGDPAPAPGHPGGGEGSYARARPSTGDAPVHRRHTGENRRHTGEKVTAPVRIADAATVRLLRPGDRVDVLAVTTAERAPAGGEARVVARGALVTKVPEPLESSMGAGDGGALVVLSVPRSTASRLAGASATARLAVTLW
ncbi:RcpC/CpaB family pilus assembly protein [Streptomyces sp. NPDC096132]|uniref:RcpC/CpaB family pilus assembly protein n=1 Tax=Streptomyces sp. NPDC096132 TaxID=3366075 RepID=UPI0037FAA193